MPRYISDPFLLGGLKWDMRTYVTVTSFNPLEAFVYKDGFARFTTVPYNTSSEDIDNKFVHLTNSSIQRHNEDNFMQEEGANATRREDALLGGTKISFGMLQERLKACGVEWATVWAKMVEVILKSLCMAEDHIPFQVPPAFLRLLKNCRKSQIMRTRRRGWTTDAKEPTCCRSSHASGPRPVDVVNSSVI